MSSRAPWQPCSICGLYRETMIQCAACPEDSCVEHAARHMQGHVDAARLFLNVHKAEKGNRQEAATNGA